jgi:hypothetical protein
MIRSKAEKEIYAQIHPEDERLPYPLCKHESAGWDDEWVYRIPVKDKQAVLDALWPFTNKPKLDDIMFDIHEGKTFTVRDFKVIRYDNRNMIVSPYYCSQGGTCLDFIYPEDGIKPFEIDLKKVKKENEKC